MGLASGLYATFFSRVAEVLEVVVLFDFTGAGAGAGAAPWATVGASAARPAPASLRGRLPFAASIWSSPATSSAGTGAGGGGGANAPSPLVSAAIAESRAASNTPAARRRVS